MVEECILACSRIRVCAFALPTPWAGWLAGLAPTPRDGGGSTRVLRALGLLGGLLPCACGPASLLSSLGGRCWCWLGSGGPWFCLASCWGVALVGVGRCFGGRLVGGGGVWGLAPSRPLSWLLCWFRCLLAVLVGGFFLPTAVALGGAQALAVVRLTTLQAPVVLLRGSASGATVA